MNRLERYEVISGTTVVTSFRSNKEKAQYHYFNTNGAYKKHRAMMDTAFQLVDAGVINSGWLMAMNENYLEDKLIKAAMGQRARSWDVNYCVSTLQERTEKGYAKMAAVMAGELDRAGQPT